MTAIDNHLVLVDRSCSAVVYNQYLVVAGGGELNADYHLLRS